jgi:hypothetical protein
MKVQKTIMMFSRWIQRGEINICNGDGRTYDIKSNVGGEHGYLKKYCPEYLNKEEKDIPIEIHKARAERLAYEGRRNAQYYNFAGEIIDIFKTQDFDKKILKKVFLSAEEVSWFCENSDIPLPDFWFLESKNIKNTKDINVSANLENSTKLLKILLSAKKDFFDIGDIPKKEQQVFNIKEKYLISQRSALSIYSILKPDKKRRGKKEKYI